MSESAVYCHLQSVALDQVIRMFQEIHISDVERLVSNNRWNIEGLNNNCFFVTLARLLGTDARELARCLQRQAGGVDIFDAYGILEQLDVRFNTWQFSEGESGGSHSSDLTHSRPEALVLGRPLGYPLIPTRVVGVAYLQRNREGYVGQLVVCQSPGTPYRRYMDYQRIGSGVDITSEVRRSRVSVVFSVDPLAGGTFVQEQRPHIENMEMLELLEGTLRKIADEQMEVDYPHYELHR